MDNNDDPISQLVEMYKHSVLQARTYQQLAGVSRSGGIPLPEEIGNTELRHYRTVSFIDFAL